MQNDRTFQCCYCGRETPRGNPYFPFCCRRCKMADLGRWMLEDYKISEPLPNAEEPATEDEPD